jgi:hypothetical protein
MKTGIAIIGVGVAIAITGMVLTPDMNPNETLDSLAIRRKPYHIISYSGAAIAAIGSLIYVTHKK